MANRKVGVIHPGEMGVSFAAALRQLGHDVLWASGGRSAESTQRANDAGLVDVGSIAAIVQSAEMICSICPPHAARDVAKAVAGFKGLYLDANAVAPATTREIGKIIESGGGQFVDGGIIGGPNAPRLCLSGPQAKAFVEIFSGSAVESEIVSELIGAASALKMAYGAWTKGASALLLDVRALARAEGVESGLLSNWSRTSPELVERSWRAAEQAANKGWRWVGEMEEIAITFAGAGLPNGFHQAAAEIYRRSPHIPGAPIDADTFEAVVGELGGRGD